MISSPIELTGDDSAHFLQCPFCEGSTLYQDAVTKFSDNGFKVRTTGSEATVTLDRNADNPSEERDGIRIEFSCEFCGGDLELVIKQHMGTEQVYWNRV